nr:hypothetical protein [Persicitalea jodogahamensis]
MDKLAKGRKMEKILRAS